MIAMNHFIEKIDVLDTAMINFLLPFAVVLVQVESAVAAILRLEPPVKVAGLVIRGQEAESDGEDSAAAIPRCQRSVCSKTRHGKLRSNHDVVPKN